MLKHIFSETIRPIELKFHMKSPYDMLANICTNFSGHMTKMATTPIYGKTLYLLLWKQKANNLGTWYVALEMWALPGLHQRLFWVDLDLLYGRSHFLMHLLWKNLEMFIFL